MDKNITFENEFDKFRLMCLTFYLYRDIATNPDKYYDRFKEIVERNYKNSLGYYVIHESSLAFMVGPFITSLVGATDLSVAGPVFMSSMFASLTNSFIKSKRIKEETFSLYEHFVFDILKFLMVDTNIDNVIEGLINSPIQIPETIIAKPISFAYRNIPFVLDSAEENFNNLFYLSLSLFNTNDPSNQEAIKCIYLNMRNESLYNMFSHNSSVSSEQGYTRKPEIIDGGK